MTVRLNQACQRIKGIRRERIEAAIVDVLGDPENPVLQPGKEARFKKLCRHVVGVPMGCLGLDQLLSKELTDLLREFPEAFAP